MSFPVPGTLMIEPTESEDLAELDRFVATMVAIRAELDTVAAGRWTACDSPLRHSPHTAARLVEEWTASYSREVAVFPAGTPGRQVLAARATDRLSGVWGLVVGRAGSPRAQSEPAVSPPSG